MIQRGSRVMVREDLQVGLGVVKEQLDSKGKIYEVDSFVGYTVSLKGSDFIWKLSDLKEICN